MTTSSPDTIRAADPGQPVSSVPSPQLTAWRTFLEAHARTTELLAQELREGEGIALTWYDVLVQLSEAHDHRLRMQELAERVLLSKSGLTRLIDRMERHHLVHRSACPSDRRGTFAQLTPEGLAMLRKAAPTHLRGVREHFAELLDDEEAATLAELLGRIADAATVSRAD